jgi:hypothetical protein
MANEAIYVTPELKKRLIRDANEAEMTLDEYLASRVGGKAASPSTGGTNGNGGAVLTPHAQRVRERLEEMQDLYMMKAMSTGQTPTLSSAPSADAATEKLLARLDRIEERLEARQAAPAEDTLGLNQAIRSAIQMRAMTPIFKVIGGDEDGSGGNKLFREYEKELREKVDKVQADMLQQLRAKDAQIADIKDAQSAARLEDMREMVHGLENRIGELTDQVRTGPQSQQATVVDQLTTALNQAAQVQTVLETLAKKNQPAPPAAGDKQDTIHTIAYLANELSGAVSKGLEAVARVNMAQHGGNPDAIGRMPAPGAPPPTYQPQYVETRTPARPSAAPGRMRANPPNSATRVQPGTRLTFEGGRQPPISAPAAQASPRAAFGPHRRTDIAAAPRPGGGQVPRAARRADLSRAVPGPSGGNIPTDRKGSRAGLRHEQQPAARAGECAPISTGRGGVR